jgi:hydroxyacylglutathione hydrolase
LFFRQFYDTPLAQASYLIGCQATGEAIVLDPLRDAEPYVRVASQEGLTIVAVTETHIHADFVSGTRELAALTGARMLLSATGGVEWQYDFASSDNATLLRDGDSFLVGNIRFDVIATPGHTPEHIAFVVIDMPAAAGAMGILTGDFVFVGDVGRPDLLEKAAKVAGTMEASARTLFHSLQRFRALPDHLQVWPGHGAGSACGKALGAVPFSTVGYEKLANWALNISDEHEFVKQVLVGQPDPPRYFANMKRVNKAGPRVLRGIVMPPKLPPASVYALANSDALIIDTRKAAAFATAHIPRALSIPYNKSFSQWAGWLVDENAEITLLVDADEHEMHPAALQNAVRDLAFIGIDHVTGWIDQHALRAWTDAGESLASIKQMTAHEAQRAVQAGELQVLDVRANDEWKEEHIVGAINIPVGHLLTNLDALPATPIVTQCHSGGRSSIAASVLQRAGRTDVINLVGGIKGWTANNLPTESEQ